MVLLLGSVATCGWTQDSFSGGRGAEWRPLAVARMGQVATLTIEPRDALGGRLLIVVDKPDWMTLDDVTAPTLQALSVDGQRVEAGGRLELSAEGVGPRLRVVVRDEHNPIAPGSLAITVDGRRLPPETVERIEPGLAATFDLTSLGVGGHEGAVEACDLAPAGNTLRVPLRVAIDGILRHDDGRTITITRNGHEYVLGGDKRGQAFLRFADAGPSAYLSTQVGDKFIYARDVTAIQDLEDGHGLRLRTDVIGIDGQDFGQIAELDFDVTTQPDFPGLLLTSRARNLGAAAEVYCFWGWLPGDGFVTSDGEQAWSMTYRDIGNVGWVFLPATKPGLPGIGMLSPLRFGESRFGTLLLYTDPQRIPTAHGEAVAMRLAVMQAGGAEAVADAHAALEANGWLASP